MKVCFILLCGLALAALGYYNYCNCRRKAAHLVEQVKQLNL